MFPELSLELERLYMDMKSLLVRQHFGTRVGGGAKSVTSIETVWARNLKKFFKLNCEASTRPTCG